MSLIKEQQLKVQSGLVSELRNDLKRVLKDVQEAKPMIPISQGLSTGYMYFMST